MEISPQNYSLCNIPNKEKLCVHTTEQRTVVDELRIIRTQMRSTTDQKMATVVWDALYDTTQ